MKTRVQIITGKILIGIMILNSLTGLILLPTEVQAQRAVVINADQPNVWTLEQAHYLLAQMHRRNLDLKAKSLEDLDANEINGLRFEVVRTLIELGVKFDQADLASNKLLAQNRTFNTERRQSLISRRDKLSEESLNLTREISQLESDKANAENDDDKDKLDKQIAAKKALRDKVDKEIEQINSELEGLPAPSGDFKSTQAEVNFDPNKLPKSIFDDAFKEAAKKQIEDFNKSPTLNASLRLENFLQLQYEIIAKQLTLLRDEVGPGERLLFLELPQTVNSTYDKADKKWAQSWWKIAGYTRRVEASKKNIETTATPSPTPATEFKLENPQPITTVQDYNSLLNNNVITIEGERKKATTSSTSSINLVNEFVNLDKIDYENMDQKLKDYLGAEKEKDSNEYSTKINLSNRLIRTVDLIPRQSSLNVNDMKLQVKSGVLSLVASFLFGFGARLNVQRQREQFSQFVQQELYSAAFGKGSREFGWTFTPMPGTDRLLSGVRTTYAVVVVPEEATSLIVESNGCYFPRSEYQPTDFADTKNTSKWGQSRKSRGCNDKTKAFIVSIPSGSIGGNEFWVEGVSYQPVGKGKRIVVSISGKNFSSQMGVLINGVPLLQAIGLAQPLLRDDSKTGIATVDDLKKEQIQGRVERIDSNKIVFSFSMPDDFAGTPTITLIGPGRATDINWIKLDEINGQSNLSLIDYSPKMFGQKPKPDSFRIDDMEIFRTAYGDLKALISGAGFSGTDKNGNPFIIDTTTGKLFINGLERRFQVISPSLIEVTDFRPPSEDKIRATLVYGGDKIESELVDNPAYMKVNKVIVVSYEAPREKKPGVLIVRLEGVGFSEGLRSLDRRVKVTVTSSTEAFLKITNPDEAEFVTLTNPAATISVNLVVTRKPPK
jgi:hypothetical protein